MKKMVYFAHPVTHYGTNCERVIVGQLEAMGFVVMNPNSQYMEDAYKREGMQVFLNAILRCDCLAYSTFDDGALGAGVAKELAYAETIGMPVFQIGTGSHNHCVLTVEQTRDRIKRGQL